MIYNLGIANLHGNDIYIIGNHKQCIVYNDHWFEFVKHCVAALAMELYPRWRKIFRRTRGMVLSTQGLTYNSKTLLICFAERGFLHLVGRAESLWPLETNNHLQA